MTKVQDISVDDRNRAIKFLKATPSLAVVVRKTGLNLRTLKHLRDGQTCEPATVRMVLRFADILR